MLDAETERHIAEQQAALAANPDWAEGHLHLALLYRIHHSRREDARHELLRALELKPGLAEAHIALGEIYLSEGDGARAHIHAKYAAQFGNSRLLDQMDRHQSPWREYWLHSERLAFGYWSENDAALAQQLWGDPQVTRLFGGPFTPAQVEQRLNQEIAWQRSFGVQYWPLFLQESDAFAGCCGLRPRDRQARIYEMGFHLCPEFWGRGIATEAARAVIHHAFNTLGAASLFAGHHPENHASRHVLEKLGFQFTHAELFPPTGQMHRCYVLDCPA